MDKSKFAVTTYDKIADKYTQRYFDDLSDSSYIDKFLSYLPKKAKVLDIGCGPGTFINYTRKKGFDVEGVDLSEEMIKIAKQKNPEGNFKVMDMRKLNYDDASYDSLLAAYSLIHIPSEEIPSTLRGFNRVLRPNGTLMIIAQKGEPDRIVDEPLKKGERVFINFFTLKRLSKFVTDAGFEIEYKKEAKPQDPESMSDRVIYLIARKK